MIGILIWSAGAIILASPASAGEDCEPRLTEPALALAGRIEQLVHHARAAARDNRPITLAFDTSTLLRDFVRDGLGTPDQVELALRARDVPVYLLAVHRSHLDNARLDIRGLRDEARTDHFIHISGEGPTIAAEHRRHFDISDEAKNLENLAGAGYLVTGHRDVDVTADVAQFVAQLDRELAPYVALARTPLARELNSGVLSAILRYLADYLDVTPAMFETQLRAADSVVHLVAVPKEMYGEHLRVVPIGGRLPAPASLVLDVFLVKSALMPAVLERLHVTAEENLERLNNVGVLIEGAAIVSH